MNKYGLLFGLYYLTSGALLADSIPSLTATVSTIEGAQPCIPTASDCRASLFAAADSFTLSGSGFSGPGGRVGFIPGSYPTFFDISSIPGSQFEDAFGQFVLVGATYFVEYNGSALVSAPPVVVSPVGGIDSPIFSVTSGDISAPQITPTSPSTTILLPASVQGSFRACVPTFLHCDASSPTIADVSLVLTGQAALTISVFYLGGTFPEFADISESFASTPVPEPGSMLLIALGVVVALKLTVQASSISSVCDRLRFASERNRAAAAHWWAERSHRLCSNRQTPSSAQPRKDQGILSPGAL